jgi:short subunit dehydrogenase-like uncharacterized protein
MASRLDLCVYGATGFTGELVCEYILERYPNHFRWGIAGRSPAKLADLLKRLEDRFGDAAIVRTRPVLTLISPLHLSSLSLTHTRPLSLFFLALLPSF